MPNRATNNRFYSGNSILGTPLRDQGGSEPFDDARISGGELQRARKRIDDEAAVEQAGGALAARDKNPGERENDDCRPQDQLAALPPGRDAKHQQRFELIRTATMFADFKDCGDCGKR